MRLSHWNRYLMAGAGVLGATLFAVPFASAHGVGVIGAQLAGSEGMSSITQQSAQTTTGTSTSVGRAAVGGQVASNASAMAAGEGAAAGSASAAGQGNRTGGTNSTGCNDGTVSVTPDAIWPPNHKMVTVTITYVDNDGDGDTTAIVVGAITDNQMTNGVEDVGSGQPAAQQGADWSGTGNMGTGSDGGGNAQTTAQVRAERSGTDPSGRTYDIKVTCTDSNGSATAGAGEGPMMSEMQTVDLFVTVPHDQGNH